VQSFGASPARVRFAVPMPTIGTLPVWIAKERRFFAKKGLGVKVMVFPGWKPNCSLFQSQFPLRFFQEARPE
jgi:ABC-type nitrate/sulfonate/bicarbonate transport system substrate-binding protein